MITEKIKEKLIFHRRFFHANAETGFDTKNTSKYIYDTLCTAGIECFCLENNTVVGNIYGKNKGETILLRADIDALPINEETSLPYSCKNGNMHACGHDFHASMLLCAAEILQGAKDRLFGNVRLLFQPAEEILKGAESAIERGVLDDVDFAMTIHVMTATDIPTGKVLLSFDTPCAPSCDFFEMKIIGKGCHGSSPVLGIDPISASCRIIDAICHIRTHEIGIHEKAVLTVGEIHGGNSANIIPDSVTMRGTLRCFDENVRSFYKRRFEEIAKCIAQAFRCECEIEYTSSCPSLINDKTLLERTKENLEELLGKENIISIKDTKSDLQGSEDFAYISQKVPSVTVAIAAGCKKDGHNYPLHNQSVTFDENALEVGCRVFTHNALKILDKQNHKDTPR